MQDQVIRRLLLRFIAMQQHKNVLFCQSVVTNAEVLAQPQRLLEMFYGFFCARHFHLISPRHNTHVGMLVFQAKDVSVIHTVKGRCVEGDADEEQ